MPEWLAGLNCVYFTLLGVGVLYALVILVAGEVHDLGMHLDLPGGDLPIDVLHGEVGIVSVSPVTIAGFVTAFGAFGLIGMGLFGATSAQSLVWAAVGGVLVGLVSHLVFIYVFVKPQGSSEVRREHLIGLTAEVITPIPASGPGEIAFVAQGARVTLPARSSGGEAIRKGALVRIDEAMGPVALVSPIPLAEAGGDG